MGHEEGHAVEVSTRGIVHHDEEACMLQVQVGIDVDEREIAQLLAAVGVLLNGKLVQLGQEVGRVILAEPRARGAQLHAQHAGHHELQIQVGEYVQLGQGHHVLVAAGLEGDDVIPVQRPQAQLLVQLCGEHRQRGVVLLESGRQPGVLLAVNGVALVKSTGTTVMTTTRWPSYLLYIMVPVMGVLYVLASLIVLLAHVTIIPSVVHLVIQDAFNFKAIFSGMAGSCMIYGIKRGLYSNEAGVGSAPNASASADVTHPVKQGLVQMLSVYIDTLLLCSATAIMCLSSGILPSVKLSGAPYVQQALSTVFGSFGPIFITIAMILFAFTTLIGNLYYVDNAVAYLNHKKKPGKGAMTIIHIICVLVIFVGAVVPMDAAWALADISMGLMTLINLPACFLLSSIVIHALRDYEEKRKTVEHPAFKGEDIGLYDLDCWQ